MLSKSLKDFNFSLYATLILSALLPIIYTTTRIFFLGNMPNDSGVNIASQSAWLQVICEVIQEALILPLFYLMGKSLNSRIDLENKIRTGLIFSFLIYLIFSAILFINTRTMLLFMSQKATILDISEKYIKIESIAILISILYQFLSVVLLTIKNNKSLLILLFCQMIITVLCDIFFVSSFSFSLNFGVLGIATTNIIVNISLFVIGIFLLKKSDITIFRKTKLSFIWLKEWLKIGSISGLESLIRNFTFIVMVLKMINLVEGQGDFWVANNFIWGWLLLPITALGQLIKRNTGEYPNKLSQYLPSYFIITSIVVCFWLITIPFWNIFIHQFMNVKDSDIVFHIAIISIGFYILFAYNNIIDSIFYGLGRTELLLTQSIAINTLFYGTLFVLFKQNKFIPTLENITLVFGTSIGLDSILTFSLFWYLKKKKLLTPPSV